MSKIVKILSDRLFFVIFRVRIFTRKKAREIAKLAKSGEKILEIGSGKKGSNGEYYFSADKYFKGKGVDFIQSDINESFGHNVIDITDFHDQEAYDQILCFHILDDVYEWEGAFINLYNGIKPGGSLHIIIPGFIPLDYPSDLFRFTEKLIKEFCKKNKLIIDKFEIHGYKRFPFAYYLRIKK